VCEMIEIHYSRIVSGFIGDGEYYYDGAKE
jgi:hypothetical protein